MKDYAFYIVFFGALLSGTSGLFVEHMSISATSMASIRSGVPVLILGFYFLLTGHRQLFREKSTTMLAGSVFNAIRMFLFFTTFVYTTMSNAIIVFYTWPLFTSILSVLVLKERITRQELLVLMISFLGVLVVYSDHEFSGGDKDFIGLSAGVLTAFFYSCSIIFFKNGADVYTPWETIFYQNVVSALIYLPFLCINTPSPSSLDWTLGISHGVVIGIIMFTMFFYGLKHLPASRASMITYVEVISAMLLGYLVLHDEITTSMIVGASMIMGGSIYLRTLKTKSKVSAA